VSNIIKFTYIDDFHPYHPPVPANKIIPEWYKNTDPYINMDKKPHMNNDGSVTIGSTIKKCMGVFDSMTMGYLVLSHTDVYVKNTETGPVYTWPGGNGLGFHPILQAPLHPSQNGYPFPKWNLPWSMKTPKDYSILCIPPLHRSLPFSIMPGIIDSDRMSAPTNFPFTLNDVSWEGLIPAGTPVAQVIPIKRESWMMEFGNENDKEKHFKDKELIDSVFMNGYKRMFWKKKEYK
jgi:hypothetical protein